jgi:hypothetical protein
MLMLAAIVILGSLFSQSNVTISDQSSHTADASAVLDVYADPSAATRLGVLLPRLNSAPNHISLATGLLYYNLGLNTFNYFNGATWKTMAIHDDIYWQPAPFPNTLEPKIPTINKVSIGTIHPAGVGGWLQVHDHTGTIFPQFEIMGSTSGGDASMKYVIYGEYAYSHGIYDDGTGLNNFKICNAATLTGPGYGDQNTMM